MARLEALRAVKAGEIGMQAVPLEIGDVLIRHPWALHRGTPTTTDVPSALPTIPLRSPLVCKTPAATWKIFHRPDIRIPDRSNSKARCAFLIQAAHLPTV